MKITSTTLILSSFLVSTAFAKTIKVPEEKNTIQAGLNSASNGDTILVNSGTYKEKISWPSVNNLTLIGKNGAEKTIIDAEKSGRVMTIGAANPKLIGLTIKGGALYSERSNGAGIYCSSIGLLIDGCIITNNTIKDTNKVGAWNFGAGIFLYNSTFTVKNSTFSYNTSSSENWAYGGGAYINGGSGEIFNSKFWKNGVSGSWSNGAGIYINDANVTLDRVKFERNGSLNNKSWCDGAAIYASASFTARTLTMTNCLLRQNFQGGGSFGKKNILYLSEYNLKMTNSTIYTNYSTLSSGEDSFGIEFDNFFTNSTAEITNSIIWGANNTAEIASNSKTTLNITFSNVRSGTTGIGNINSNPLFADSLCHLSSNSPCLNAGSNAAAPTVDIDGNLRPYPTGTNVDLGCYELPTFLATSINHDLPESSSIELVNIFPNPTKGSTYMKIEIEDGNQIESYSLFNLQGQKLINESNILSRNIILDVNNVPKGSYLIEIEKSDLTIVTKRVLIN